MTGGPASPWSLTVPGVGAAAELVSDRLWTLGATAVAEGADELLAGFGDEATARAAAAALSRSGVHCLVSVDDGAWRSAWRAFADDVVVGPLTIRCVERRSADHRTADNQTAGHRAAGHQRRVIEIDPGDSFGSGHHTSTRQCLREVVGRAGAGISVLDVGTGSGVLAVAAAALGAGPVVAVDVDPAAAAVAAANAEANAVRVGVVCGELPAVRGVFDLVVANLGGALVPISLAPALGAAVRPGGSLVLAGMLVGQAEGVSRAYAASGEVSVTVDEGWTCLAVTRSG